MRRYLLTFACAALCALTAGPLAAAELTALLPETLADFEATRDPRQQTLTSGAERAMTSYSGKPPRSLRLWITDTGDLAPDALAGLKERVKAGELTRHEWRDLPLFTKQVEMGRDQFIDAFLPVGRLVVSLRLKDHEGGEVAVADLEPALAELDQQAFHAYAEQTDAPRVLYDPFARTEPQPPVDADTLATFLPPQAGGQARGEVQRQVHGYGKKASAAVFARYGDQAEIIIIDQGGLPPGYFPLLREGVRKGLFRESSLADQPLFTRIAHGELPVDIEVPGALAVAGERFQVQVNLPDAELQPEVAREVTGAVDLQGLAELSRRLVDRETFRARFRACEPADFITAPSYNAGYRYEILGPADGGCQVRGRYTRNPNDALVGPTMTCTWDNDQAFDKVLDKTEACEGPLREKLEG